jgi:hypothetical protein
MLVAMASRKRCARPLFMQQRYRRDRPATEELVRWNRGHAEGR